MEIRFPDLKDTVHSTTFFLSKKNIGHRKTFSENSGTSVVPEILISICHIIMVADHLVIPILELKRVERICIPVSSCLFLLDLIK